MLMFVYSFLAMTSYNIAQADRHDRSSSAASGPTTCPTCCWSRAFVIGIIMSGYSPAIVSALPKKAIIPSTQVGMAGLLVVFWLLFQTGASGSRSAFYLFGLILGILLISQFWTLANDIYDPRQAKRVFGFIGGGASLGGIAGSAILAQQRRASAPTTCCWSAPRILLLCMVIVDHDPAPPAGGTSGRGRDRRGEGRRRRRGVQAAAAVEAPADHRARHRVRRHRRRPHRAAAQHGGGGVARARQHRRHRRLPRRRSSSRRRSSASSSRSGSSATSTGSLGIGFALMILPVSLGTTGIVMLLNAALWAPALARVLDHVAPLHRRQDDARDPVPAAAGRHEVQGEAVRRRHRRPVGARPPARCWRSS